MTKEKFWNFIKEEKANWFPFPTERATPAEQVDRLSSSVEKLALLEDREIAEWYQIFNEYHSIADKSELWLAGHLIHNGLSDDGFMDFRSWLISQGEDTYHKALENPESLLDADFSLGYNISASFEQLAYLPSYALQKKYGSSPPTNLFKLSQEYPLSEETLVDIHKEIRFSPGADAPWFHLSEEERKSFLPNLSKAMDNLRSQLPDPSEVILPHPNDLPTIVVKPETSVSDDLILTLPLSPNSLKKLYDENGWEKDFDFTVIPIRQPLTYPNTIQELINQWPSFSFSKANLLAHTIAELPLEEYTKLTIVAGAMLKDTISGSKQGTINHLLEHANTIKDWVLVPRIQNDYALGKFLYDNNFIPEPSEPCQSLPPYNILGKEHREDFDGILGQVGGKPIYLEPPNGLYPKELSFDLPSALENLWPEDSHSSPVWEPEL